MTCSHVPGAQCPECALGATYVDERGRLFERTAYGWQNWEPHVNWEAKLVETLDALRQAVDQLREKLP